MDEKNSTLGPDKFRKAAVQQRQKGDRVDRPLVFVGIKGWMSLVAIALLLGAAVCWMLTATIPIRVNGHGILIPDSGLTTIKAPCDGVIAEILIQEGDTLESGDCLARIDTSTASSAPRDVVCSFPASAAKSELCGC